MDKLKADNVKWVVNSAGELGVEINGQYFFCYKGESLQYDKLDKIDIEPELLVRGIGKREFGECINPAKWYTKGFTIPDVYDVEVVAGLGWPSDEVEEFYKWKPLPLL